MRSRLGLLLVPILALGLLLAAPVSAQSQDNTAVTEGTKDGKSVFKLAFAVKKATGEADATDTAAAYASCDDCRTVAASIQVVLVSDVTSAAPESVAGAVDFRCTECESLAAAFQFVYADGQEPKFTDQGKAQLQDLKKRFGALMRRGDELTLSELATEISVIAAEVAEVVDKETQVRKPSEPSAGSTSTTTTAIPPTTSTTAAGPTTTLPASTTTTIRATTTSTTAPAATTVPVTTTTP